MDGRYCCICGKPGGTSLATIRDYTHSECYQRARADLTKIRSNTLLPGDHEDFAPPMATEIRLALAAAGFAIAPKAAAYFGVSDRTVRRWRNGQLDMPYMAWRLLVVDRLHIGRYAPCVDATAVFEAKQSGREARLSARIVDRLGKLHRY